MARNSNRRDHPFGNSPTARRRLRCAVYTRKSSDEGLQQSFNSLHAQRDACEAYVASQKHEGWMLLPQPYDDGGLSGGSMDRAALQRLLDDIRSGLIDIVVVYKVDRLTRSLADFAKLTELFDAHGTSFVSVTQQFNTSTSMGRLTLNVLLSFAQFEREVAGERIRDKIALSKRRGMWMGGLPPLGYDGIDKKLIVNEAEAETVRLIFRAYLQCQSIAALKRSLDASGIVSKRRRYADGREVGGIPISRGALYQILRNRLYCGEIAYRDEIHQGNHEAIIDAERWAKVQDLLIAQSRRRRGTSQTTADGQPSPKPTQPALLVDLAFDELGHRLTPTYAIKRGRRYRYYVSAPLVRGQRDAGSIRVPAADLEDLVITTIGQHLRDDAWVYQHFGSGLDIRSTELLIAAAHGLGDRITSRDTNIHAPNPQEQDQPIRSMVSEVIVGRRRLTIEIEARAIVALLTDGDDPLDQTLTPKGTIAIEVEAQTLHCGKQVRLVVGEVETDHRTTDRQLVKLIADAHRWFEDLRTGRRATIAEIAARDRQQVSHVSRTIGFAFLAPDILELILTDRQPISLTPERLKACRPLPLEWSEQRTILLG